MEIVARSLQAFGLAITLVGLIYGISERSMSGELTMLLLGCVAFMLGRGLHRGEA